MSDAVGKFLRDVTARVAKLETREAPEIAVFAAPFTSANWDGDARSDTPKTLINLSAEFGIPAGVRAVLVQVQVRDSSSAGFRTFIILSPNATASSGIYTEATGLANGSWTAHTFICPTNVDGNIYFQIEAAGAATMNVTLQIWGYLY